MHQKLACRDPDPKERALTLLRNHPGHFSAALAVLGKSLCEPRIECLACLARGTIDIVHGSPARYKRRAFNHDPRQWIPILTTGLTSRLLCCLCKRLPTCILRGTQLPRDVSAFARITANQCLSPSHAVACTIKLPTTAIPCTCIAYAQRPLWISLQSDDDQLSRNLDSAARGCHKPSYKSAASCINHTVSI